MLFEKLWGRRLVSAFLLFHLFGVLVAPNAASYLGFTVAPVYHPYLNFFGLGSTWSFFAPEPFYQPIYIDYVVNRKEKAPVNGRFPDEVNPFWMRDRYNRRIGLARMILSTDENIRNMFVNYLCHEYPDMESANLWRVDAMEPSLEMVQKGEKKITDAAEL
ncbi:MAG: hypothetical protein ACXVC4_21305, partial [Bdellovibrionota bacterium]